MDGTYWRHAVADLRADHRCVVPTLPLGGHRIPVRAGADLSPAGHAHLVGELLERLDLDGVTLVQSDIGHAQILAGERPDRVARLVLASCEAFDNLPPGLPGKVIGLGRLPGGVNALVQPLRWRRLRRLPVTYGWMTRRPIPHEVTDGWLRGLLTDAGVRRDLQAYLRSYRPDDLLRAAERLPAFDRPALVVWAREDRVMPPEHAERLAALLPDSRLRWIDDSGTLLAEDQPGELARTVREFVAETQAGEPATSARRPSS
jgi:pimeloyl-ACP methyl ester carboxylesterase